MLKKKQFGKCERPPIYNVASVVSRDLKWWPPSALLCQDISFWSLIFSQMDRAISCFVWILTPESQNYSQVGKVSHAKEGNNGKVPWSLSQPDFKTPSFMFWVNLIMLTTIDIIIQWFAFHSDLWHHWSLFTKQCWPYFQLLSLASIVSKHLSYFLPATIIMTIYLS